MKPELRPLVGRAAWTDPEITVGVHGTDRFCDPFVFPSNDFGVSGERGEMHARIQRLAQSDVRLLGSVIEAIAVRSKAAE